MSSNHQVMIKLSKDKAKKGQLPILLGGGVVLLMAGLLALFQIFSAERDDAVSQASNLERVTADAAGRELSARLRASYSARQGAIDRAVQNPMAACANCFLRRGEEQLLPRLGPRPTPGGETVQLWHQALLDGESRGDELWAQRITLQKQCEAGDSGALAPLAEFRARFVMPAEQEIASSIALAGRCKVPGSALPSILREGIDVPGERRAEGLQPLVLRHAKRLSEEDARFVVQETLRVSNEGGVNTTEFLGRLSELQSKPLVGLGDEVRKPTIVAASDGTHYWYLVGDDNEVRGISVALNSELARVAEEMLAQGLLHDRARLEVRIPKTGTVLLENLSLHVISPQALVARQDIERRYLLKLATLALTAGMGLLIAFLGLALQRRRQRILELKSHFVAGVSHELRTPLASMRVITETLAKRVKGVEGVRDYPERLLRDIDGMSFLVENILSFHRLTKGRWEPRKDLVNLGELVGRACEDAREHTATPVEVNADLDAISLTGDPELLQLLFRNLAANGVTYNRQDTAELRVSAEVKQGKGLEVLFSDNGVGIAEADRKEAFEDFYRGQSSSMARGSGLGLGLCRRIMELHGGSIAIDSTGPTGTAIRLKFQ
jgi:signal transduction histidine kinase